MKHYCYIEYEYHTYSGFPKIDASCKAIARYTERTFAEFGKVMVTYGDNFQMLDNVMVQFLYEGSLNEKWLTEKLRTLPDECVCEGLRVTYRTNEGLQGEITQFVHPQPRRLCITKSHRGSEPKPIDQVILK